MGGTFRCGPVNVAQSRPICEHLKKCRLRWGTLAHRQSARFSVPVVMTKLKCSVCGAWRFGNCLKINPLNFDKITTVLRAEGCDAAVTIGAQICKAVCYTDEMVERHAMLVAASSHVGNALARATRTGMELGEVRALRKKPRRGVEATFITAWRRADGSEPYEEEMSVDDLELPERWGVLIDQQRGAAVAAAGRRAYQREWVGEKRLAQKMAQDAEAAACPDGPGDFNDSGFLDDDPMRGDNPGDLNKSQRETLRRGLSRRGIFDQRWWESLVTRTGTATYQRLHTFCFGFTEPHDLRAFYHLTFPDYHGPRSKRSGLGPFEHYCLALLHMRTGLPAEFISALMGTDRSHLGRHIATWVHRLGAVGRVALVGLPPAEVIHAMRPQSCDDCGMPDLGLVGDGCSLLTEAVRTSWLSTVGDQLMDSKTDHPGAKGMLFTDGCGGACIASDLALGRASEGSLVRALRDKLDGLPTHLSVCYDKGIRGLNMLLPNFNHVYMPNFLAPASGKTQFELEEAFENKGIATNRYIVEIAFQRVKSWRVLTGEIRRECFHLINSAWWWALGFSNMYMHMLKEPPAE